MEDEVVYSSWVSHLKSCSMCSWLVNRHSMSGLTPREFIKEANEKLDEWKKKHKGKEWNGYD